MTEFSDHYMRVRDFARKFSLDESTVYEMIQRGEIEVIRIDKRTLRIPSLELKRYLDRDPGAEPDPTALNKRAEAFRQEHGTEPHSFVETWRCGEVQDTAENAEIAIEALALSRSSPAV